MFDKKAWERRRAATPERKAKVAAWAKSAAGIAARVRYDASPKGKANRERKQRSAAKKARDARYWRTEKGKAVKSAKAARYRESPHGKEARRQWEVANQAKRRQADRAWQKTYRATDQGKADRIHGQSVRRARKRAGPGSHSVAEWLQKRATYGGRCHWCGRTARLSMDHIIALSAGGSNASDNLVPACTPCNSSKGARNATEWLQARVA